MKKSCRANVCVCIYKYLSVQMTQHRSVWEDKKEQQGDVEGPEIYRLR